MQLKRLARGEDGFTLIELVVTVAIVGIMVTSLGGVMISYLKASTATQSRLNETTDQQLLSAYWQQDVSSLGLRGYDPTSTSDQFPVKQSVWTSSAPSGVPTGCSSGLSGTVVIGFAWNDYPVGNPAGTAFDATVNGVVYTAQQVGLQWQLTRVRCAAGKATRSSVVSSRLTAPPIPICYQSPATVVACTSAAPLPVILTLRMIVSDRSANASTGYTTTLTAQRRQG